IEMRDRALDWCATNGVEAWACEANATTDVVSQLAMADCLIVLGGDGTFLRATRALAQVDVPVLGINSGRIGFLSKVEPDNMLATLAELVADRYDIEARMMLEATMVGAGQADTARTTGAGSPTFAALNDAAIVRGAEARVLHLDVAIDDSHLASYIADGVIVATPTGSTAYSFSAGGPILDPTARNLIVTPVAAYLSSIRSIVVGPQHTVRVRLVDGPPGIVSIDGRDDYPLSVGEAVEIRAMSRPLRFIEPPGALPFWDLLRQKAALLPA
ncbi:MAG TPA: NAD(+)/NADH kinase, partial [Vicinamibacterales bacterium]|nr:NAD(+)/NADH kinase [Vicinamibacterales bacterium]